MPPLAFLCVGAARHRKRQSGSAGSARGPFIVCAWAGLPVQSDACAETVSERIGLRQGREGECRKEGPILRWVQKCRLPHTRQAAWIIRSAGYYETIQTSCSALYERAERESSRKLLGMCCPILPLREKKRTTSISLSFPAFALNFCDTIPPQRASVNIPGV